MRRKERLAAQAGCHHEKARHPVVERPRRGPFGAKEILLNKDMILTDYEARKYQDELASRREKMTDILIEMELRRDRDSDEEFLRWWEEEGNLKKYYALKGECERIEEKLMNAQIEQTDHPRMLP